MPCPVKICFVKSSPTLLCALESGYLFKKRELIQVLIVAHVEHISSHCVLSPLLYLGLNLRFPQMPRLEFLTDFACLGQFFNVLVEISPEYWCVPSIWSSQYHGDWQFWQNFDKISPWIVVGRYLFQTGSAGLNQQRKFLYWPLGDWLITVIWYWLWNFPITLKQSGYLSAKSSLTLRSGFLDIPYCEGVPVSGVAPSGFGPSASVTKKVATVFRP